MYDFSDYVDKEQDYETAEQMEFGTLEDFYNFLDSIRNERKEG